ncbi:MAG: Csp1 family four helix bundle copper storage protein [Pseudomonadota bacterium]|nr:Csp1 family four helix bundle copper storage protein [Pseudomonadota bacterium]MDO7667961.1 Csp1 family four helix bundle copper storage protein [Pseudomonadota bacterium]
METTDASRRDLLKGLGSASVALAAGLSLSANANTTAVDHSKMNHQVPINVKLEELIDTFLECIKMGEICNQHNMHMFQMGDTALADCSIAVQELIVANTAVIRFTANNSRHLKTFLEATIKVCETCEEECKKHDKHIQCKDCAEACRDCIDFCTVYLAA